MRSHCFHSESTSRDYLTGEIHPSEKRLPSFFDVGCSFPGTRSAREIKVPGCYSKTLPEQSLFCEQKRAGYRPVNIRPPFASLFPIFSPPRLWSSLLIPRDSTRLLCPVATGNTEWFDSTSPRPPWMMHAADAAFLFLAGLNFACAASTFISRPADGPGQFDFREQF